MAYLIDKNGNKINIDLDVNTCRQVKIFNDELEFEDIYILNLYRNNGSHKSDFELVEQIRFLHFPTKEEVLYWFQQNELGCMDFYTIEKGKTLTWKQD